jgi:hypothetical protein
MSEEQDDVLLEGEYATPYNVGIKNLTQSQLSAYISRSQELPPAIKDILADFSSAEFVEEKVGPKFSLTPEQKKGFTEIVRDILIGDMYMGDMIQEIHERIGLDQSLARNLANDTVNQLFAPALDDIKKIQSERFGNRVGQNPPPVAAPPTSAARPVPGADLPETNGNIIDLRTIK